MNTRVQRLRLWWRGLRSRLYLVSVELPAGNTASVFVFAVTPDDAITQARLALRITTPGSESLPASCELSQYHTIVVGHANGFSAMPRQETPR